MIDPTIKKLRAGSVLLAVLVLAFVVAAALERRRPMTAEQSEEAAWGAWFMESRSRADSVRSLRETFSDSALQAIGLPSTDSLLATARAAIETVRERGTASRDSIGAEIERRIPGALAAIDGWSAWRRAEFGNDTTPSVGDRYGLFTECAPVLLSQLGVFVAADIQVMAESRLRAARIWGGHEPDDGGSHPFVLYIAIAAEAAEFSKEVWDPISGEFRVSDVWSGELPGPFSGTPGSRASTLVDRFILDYLRVNGEYCQ